MIASKYCWRHSASALLVTACVSWSHGQLTRKQCSHGLEVTLRAEYVGPYISGVASGVNLQYRFSKAASGSEAWIEIWDGPNRLFQQVVPLRSPGQIVWKHLREVPESPSSLQLAIVDPGLPASGGDSQTARQSAVVSTVLAGTAPNEDAPFPSLVGGAARLVEGGDWADLVLEGMLLGPATRILLQEKDVTGSWIPQEFLKTELVDLQHVRVQLPSRYLARPTLLGLSAYRDDLEANDAIAPAHTVYVVSKDSPVLESIDPAEVSADDALKGPPTVRLHGSGFTRASKGLLSLENAGDLDYAALSTDFRTPNELQITLSQDKFIVDHKWSSSEPIRLWIANDDQFHVSNAQDLQIISTPALPSYPSTVAPSITSISPYPVSLMHTGSPAFTVLQLQGANFRPVDEVVIVDEHGNSKKLKTRYDSPNEVHAWLPRDLWRQHRLRFKLILRTAAKQCVAEMTEED